MLKKKKGFVDKGLYGLKDKLKASSEAAAEEVKEAEYQNVENVENAENEQKAEEHPSEQIINTPPPLIPNEITNTSVTYPEEKTVMPKAEKSEEINLPKPDKEFLKALEKRKEEYQRTKKHVVEKVESTLNRLPLLTSELRRKLSEIEKAETSIRNSLTEINTIDEKSWKNDDYSSELGIAAKTVENTRLQHIMLMDKLTVIDEQKETAAVSAQHSIIPELTSLRFFQLFKMGFGFSLPLILGLIITAAIISVTIFFVMGGF